MSCQEFQSFVKKKFAFLLEEYGFSIIHTEEVKTRSDHCIIGFGSSICHIQIYRTWEDVNIWISQQGAPFGWEVNRIENNPRWYAIDGVIAFLSHRRRHSLEWWWSHSIDQILSTFAQEMKALMPQILSIYIDSTLLGELDKFTQEEKVD